MRILNLGSLNIDKVYDVEHFAEAGETLLSRSFETFCGGKGLNQSVALANAGVDVYHAGAVGVDGDILCSILNSANVNTDYILKTNGISGHAIIQLNPKRQNCIIVCPGANGEITRNNIDSILDGFGKEDLLLLQNEISNVDYAIAKAKDKGIRIAFNASPITADLTGYPLELVDFFLINEVEGKLLAGIEEGDNRCILEALHHRFPDAAIVLTVGREGVLYRDNTITAHHGIYRIEVSDTTAAGDTFCGFFLAGIAKNQTVEDALRYASLASSLAVSKKGAANSIPLWGDVESFATTAVEC